mmetsp:Transcript_36592/g.84587  ORF Transcript_36592/g.84587 Transcript_36592/m.84587 type:complete len:327 (-) Transcript_36592:26-1006(-)
MAHVARVRLPLQALVGPLGLFLLVHGHGHPLHDRIHFQGVTVVDLFHLHELHLQAATLFDGLRRRRLGEGEFLAELAAVLLQDFSVLLLPLPLFLEPSELLHRGVPVRRQPPRVDGRVLGGLLLDHLGGVPGGRLRRFGQLGGGGGGRVDQGLLGFQELVLEVFGQFLRSRVVLLVHAGDVLLQRLHRLRVLLRYGHHGLGVLGVRRLLDRGHRVGHRLLVVAFDFEYRRRVPLGCALHLGLHLGDASHQCALCLFRRHQSCRVCSVGDLLVHLDGHSRCGRRWRGVWGRRRCGRGARCGRSRRRRQAGDCIVGGGRRRAHRWRQR